MKNKFVSCLVSVVFLLGSFACLAEVKNNSQQVKVPILLYHRLSPEVKNQMTVDPAVFASQLQWLKDHNYKVIPLRSLVNYLQGIGPAPASNSVVIVSDDGSKTVYTQMLPIVKKYNIPVTLFIYPGAISSSAASSAMTWDELKELKSTGLFDIQSHTLTHPNFKQERKKLTPQEYEKFVDRELAEPKKILEQKLNIKVDLLAYPFGIYDQYLEEHAARAGYVAAFTIVRHHASLVRPIMAQPRYIILNTDGTKNFAAIVEGREDKL